MNQRHIVKVPFFKVTTTKVTTWFRLDGYNRKEQVNQKSLDNLKDGKVKGKISAKSSKKMRAIIDNWVSAIEFKMDRSDRRSGGIRKHITFVTLTLSAKQQHDDKFIRRHMLGDLIRKLKERHGMRNYLHCSEAQKNGNIHFHIVCDRYVDHKELRKDWNDVQDNYGYIDRFASKHNHRDPNSTDVHSFRKVRSIANYLTKYFTKELGRRPVQGRLWGCSDMLRDCECFNDLIDSRFDQMIDAMPPLMRKKAYHDDWYSVFRIGNFRDLKRMALSLWEYLSAFYCQQFDILYGVPT